MRSAKATFLLIFFSSAGFACEAKTSSEVVSAHAKIDPWQEIDADFKGCEGA